MKLHPGRSLLSGLALAVICAVAGAPAALGQEAEGNMPGLALSNDQPIQIESDKLEIKEEDGRAVFTGNVKVVQGDTTMQAGTMTVHYSSDTGTVTSGATDIEKIEVEDKVVLRTATQTASADTGTFNMVTQIAVLEGEKVVLTEGENILIGCKLTVHMEGGEAKMEGCPGRRLMMQLDPKSRSDQ